MQSEKQVDIDVQDSVSLREHTTFHVGGRAEYFVSVTSVTELQKAVLWAREKNIPITVLGGGSNVFVSDNGVRGLVIHNAIKGRNSDEAGDTVTLTVGAGEVFDEIVAFTVENGWWGLENLSCIPGSVGATPIQNIGAYGVEIQEHIVSVDVYDMEKNMLTQLQKEECVFGYRDSRFKHPEGKKYIVVGVTYILSKKPNPKLHYRDLALWRESYTAEKQDTELPTIQDIRSAVCAIRSKKFPDWNVMGTAGSFFKNPIIPEVRFNELLKQYPLLPGHSAGDGLVKVSLGWVLDHMLHLRGYKEGNVGTYEGQALVLVNHGNATAVELEHFVHAITQKIFEATGITAEWEVTKLS